MSPPRWRLVTVDIDGTLTTTHGWEVIAQRVGREQDYQRIGRAFRAGELDEDSNLQALLGLAEGRRPEEVEAAIAATPKLSGIPEGVARLHAAGVRVALLTHNPPYVTDWYRRFGGFDDAAGMAGRQPVGEFVGRAEGIRADKRGGLRALAERAGVAPAEIVHVGDARPDALVFAWVGRGIAINARDRAVEEAAHVRLRTERFQDVVDTVLESGAPD